MRSRLVMMAAGLMSLAVAAHAQSSMAPDQAPYQPPAPSDTPGPPAPPPPPLVDQPGDATSANSNLSDRTVIRDGTEVRETPDASSQLLGSLNAGTQVLAIGSADGWTHVIVGGTDGFVNSQALK